MVETGKRPRQQNDNGSDVQNHRKRANVKEDTDRGELVIYRILCPGNVMGSVIGKGGKVINSIRQESHARINVVDAFPGTDKRVLIIFCHAKDRDPNLPNDVDDYDNTTPLCPAQDALVKVHETIVKALIFANDSDKMDKQEAVLLVPLSQSANIIGKSGSTIKRLRSKTGAIIRVTPKDSSDATHSCAMDFDNFVSISGDSEAVLQALFAISSIMCKFLPKENISLDTSVHDFPLKNIVPSDASVYSASTFYPTADVVIPPSGSLAPLMGTTTEIPELHGYSGNASAWPLYSSAVPVVSGLGGPPSSEELVIRVLCPSDKIGRVIGKGGSTVNSIRQSSGARVEVDDMKKKFDECIITVTSNESTHDMKSAAVEAVLLLQGKINDEDEENVNIRLLVPSKVVGSLIGKSGSIINDIRKKTRANILISKGDKPKCAASSDELIEVFGEVSNLRDALAQITMRLREAALTDRDENQNASSANTSRTNPLPMPFLSTIPSVASFDYEQNESAFGLSGRPASSVYSFGSYQATEKDYGSFSSSSKMFGGLPSYVEMVIPANAVSKVFGRGGGNIENIRKISGAQIDIINSKSSRSEHIARISGTSEQKRSAENLIQAFIMAT